MSFIGEMKIKLFRKWDIIGMDFYNGEIHIKQENADYMNPIKIKPEDVTFFSYDKRQPFVGIEFLGLKTKKGNFIYRSETMEKDLYYKMLDFLGVDRLRSMRKRVIMIQLLFASVLFSLGIISYRSGRGNIHSLLFTFVMINVISAIYHFMRIQRQIRDLREHVQ